MHFFKLIDGWMDDVSIYYPLCKIYVSIYLWTVLFMHFQLTIERVSSDLSVCFGLFRLSIEFYTVTNFNLIVLDLSSRPPQLPSR